METANSNTVQVKATVPVDPVIYDKEINRLLLQNFKIHLLKTGKVCPRPWHWGYFYNAFQPLYESLWLMGWWQTSDQEKRDRFIEQLDYLAQHTLRFRRAYHFLCGIEDSDWHFARNSYFIPGKKTGY